MDGVSYTSASQAQTQSQVSLIALKTAVAAQRQVSDMLAKQAEQTQAQASNPPGVGGNVDTYA